MAANLQLVISAIDRASGDLKKIGNEADGLGSKMAGLGKAAAIGAGAGVVALGGFLASSVKEAMESQKVMAQLDAVLKSTSGAAGFTADQLADMAGALQKTTTFSDDAILSMQSVLLTFTQIKGPQFEGATQAILDMSTALGQDLQSSAIQVGKALNDPINGVGALSRVGVSFTEAQKNQIKAMVEAGDAAGAQALILKELQVEFGGSAEAAGNTFGGKLTRLKNQFGELQEKIGGAILPILSDLAQWFLDHQADIEKFIRDVVEKLKDKFEDLKPTLKAVAGFLRDQAVPAFAQLKQTMKGLVDFFSENEVALLALGVALGILVVALFPIPAAILAVIAAGTLILAHWDEIRNKATELYDTVVGKVTGIIDTIKGLPVIGEIFKTAWANVLTIVQFAWADIKNTVDTAIKVVKDIINIVMALIHGDFGAAWDGIKQLVTDVWDGIKEAIGLRLELIKDLLWNGIQGLLGVVTDLMPLVKAGITGAIDEAAKFLEGLPERMKNAGGAIADAILAGFKAAWNAAASAINSAIPDSIGFSIPGVNMPAPIPDIPGFDATISLPANPIPKLARGGFVARTGLAVVHEGETYSGVTPGKTGMGIDYDRLAEAMVRAVTGMSVQMDGQEVGRLISGWQGHQANLYSRGG